MGVSHFLEKIGRHSKGVLSPLYQDYTIIPREGGYLYVIIRGVPQGVLSEYNSYGVISHTNYFHPEVAGW